VWISSGCGRGRRDLLLLWWVSSDASKRVERESPRGDRGEVARGEVARGGVARGDVTRRGEVAGDRRRGVERGNVDMSTKGAGRRGSF